MHNTSAYVIYIVCYVEEHWMQFTSLPLMCLSVQISFPRRPAYFHLCSVTLLLLLVLYQFLCQSMNDVHGSTCQSGTFLYPRFLQFWSAFSQNHRPKPWPSRHCRPCWTSLLTSSIDESLNQEVHHSKRPVDTSIHSGSCVHVRLFPVFLA